MHFFSRNRVLSMAVAVSLTPGTMLMARDLGNFDINVAEAGKIALRLPSVSSSNASSVDAIGRAAFTWVQRDWPAADRAKVLDLESVARAHVESLLGNAKNVHRASQSLVLHKVDRQRGDSALVQFRARFDGIDIFHEDLALLMDRNQRLLAMRGPLPRIEAADVTHTRKFRLSAAQAIAAALAPYDFASDVVNHLQLVGNGGEYQHFLMRRGVRGKAGALISGRLRAKRMYFRTADGLSSAWYVETQVAHAPGQAAQGYAHVISAGDGNTLFRMNQGAHAEPYSYRVWAENNIDRLPYPSPQGRNATPDPDGLPTNNVVPSVAQELRTLANAPFSRSATDGWLAPGATTTQGNNVTAYADIISPDGFDPGDLLPTLTGPHSFDYLFDSNSAPNANDGQRLAATVQLFYWVNWLHDWFYDSGFTETDGNAQASNYGRGGLADDLIIAQAQDHAAVGGAFMVTPADGTSPRMEMGLFQTSVQRDSSVDGTVIAHEWAHYMSNRLVLNSTGLSTQNAGGMGEGWSEFVALLATVKEEDRLLASNTGFNGTYANAGYAYNQSYSGGRRYPFSTDPLKNPLRLRHIVDGIALPTTPPPAFGANGANNSEAHNQGEIWASALWDCYVGMLNDTPRLNFATAQHRMKDYLIGGLKLTPAAPTMIEARDAILATVLASGDMADFALFAAGFAKRGLGAGATIPDRYSTSMQGTVESTLTGGAIAVTSVRVSAPRGCDADSVFDHNETATLTLTLRNSGFTPLAATTVTLSTDHPALKFLSGNTLALGGLPLFGSTSASVPILLEREYGVATNTPVTLTVTADAPGIDAAPGITRTLQMFVNFDELARSSTTESFDGLNLGWVGLSQPTGPGSQSWLPRAENQSRFLHGPDENANAVTWTQSPPMSVGSGPLTLRLNHRYQFEFDTATSIAHDGGVIQVSTDGGANWADIDADAAGMDVATLSGCCGNPFAGQRAYVGESAGYPAFVDREINFGTQYANQPNFRIRFGVATNASVTAAGWDINRIDISGSNDSPFTTVVPQAQACTVASNKLLQGALGGTYYSSSRSGEGVLVDFGQVGGTPTLFFTWYTYGSGTQQWLVGSNTFAASDTRVAVDLVNTRGANFGSAFRPEDVVRSPWGRVTLSFPDCDTLALAYQKRGGEAGMQILTRVLERLDSGQCNLLQGGRSGTYYSTARSGEGVLVDFGQAGGMPVEFFTWYTYDAGSQQWLVGSQTFSASDTSVAVDLITTRGADFGNSFHPRDVVRTPWGRVTQRFPDCNTLELSYQKLGGESGTHTLTRALGSLATGQCH